MFLNVWVYADSIRRFPIVPDIISLFSLKIIFATIIKSVLYAVCYCTTTFRWYLPFVSSLLLGVFLFPVLYFIVAQYGDSLSDGTDYDLAIHVFKLVSGGASLRKMTAMCEWRPDPVYTRINQNKKII